MDRILYTYFRSSAAYRVRIALNLKGLEASHIPVHLVRDGGEHLKPEYKAINPQGLVPVFGEDGMRVSQSLAILEYLEEKYPTTPLLPSALADRAYVRQLALVIACEIHPLNNLRVLKYLSSTLGVADAAKSDWIKHWIAQGFEALEAEIQAAGHSGGFCFGEAPTLADCCLVPQVFNARRFEVDLSAYPALVAIDERCAALPAFQQAHPSAQADAQ
ncbi:maleylacetoacetate isomerase [Acidovorax sp. LjRoot66]|uniref:maleylacetoacetate isomerase n=1 Tax=Acidovorax sp. LjRoot66 TaxID=3342334 RepID=UPI003ECDDF54